jgi:beta-phosphoglucomutase-like phosphatase (HAD superfamily)
MLVPLMNNLFYIFAALISFQNCFGDVKAVLFDCDGTLVDSELAHYLGWKQALKNLGADLPWEEYYQYVGKSADIKAAMIAEKIGHNDPQLILQMKRQFYWEYTKNGLPTIQPTVDFLKLLSTKKEQLGIKLGVCSAANRLELNAHLEHLGIVDLLDIVLSGHDDLGEYTDPEGVNKPKPYIYTHAMKQLGVLPSECVVIEDSATGVAAGVAAGCFTIAVPNDYTRDQDLSLTTLHLDSFSDMDINTFLKMVNAPPSP